MNKKVYEEFKEIKDVYTLQCICTDLKDKLEKKELLIKETIDQIRKNCVDDEFYINLSRKEKNIIDILTTLENESDIK